MNSEVYREDDHTLSNSQETNSAIAAVFDRIARFYDYDYRGYNDDVDAICSLADACGAPLLEVGCGTGRLLLPLAEAGFATTGVDISAGLLDVARAKLADAGMTDRVQLIQGDMRSVTLAQTNYRFAFCTSNTFMHFASPDEQITVLQNIHRHLASGGHLLIDLFNPDLARLLEVNGVQELADQWEDEETGAQILKWSVRTVDLAEQLQDTLFIYEEIAVDGSVQQTLCPFTLRYLWRDEAALMLQVAGFQVDAVWGDFDGSDYDSQSEHLILLATAKS